MAGATFLKWALTSIVGFYFFITTGLFASCNPKVKSREEKRLEGCFSGHLQHKQPELNPLHSNHYLSRLHVLLCIALNFFFEYASVEQALKKIFDPNGEQYFMRSQPLQDNSNNDSSFSADGNSSASKFALRFLGSVSRFQLFYLP